MSIPSRTKNTPALPLAVALALATPRLAHAQTPATLVPGAFVAAPTGLTLGSTDTIRVLHNGVPTNVPLSLFGIAGTVASTATPTPTPTPVSTPTPTPTTPNTVTLAGSTFAPSAGYNTGTTTTTGGGNVAVVLTMAPIDHYAPAGNLTAMSGVGTWTAKVAISEAGSNYYEAGLLLVSADGTANSKLRLQYPGSSTGYIGLDGSNSTVANVGNIDSSAGANGGPLCMRAVNNGTNWTYAVSATCAQGTFTVIGTVPVSAMATLTQIGPYVDAWDSQQAGVPAILTMSGWSATTATDPQAALQ